LSPNAKIFAHYRGLEDATDIVMRVDSTHRQSLFRRSYFLVMRLNMLAGWLRVFDKLGKKVK